MTVRRADGSLVCERCQVADTTRSRLRGLLGRAGLEPGEGVLLRPTGSIHTWFMRFEIDAVFLDRDLRVVRVVSRLRPWRVAAGRRAHAVLELPAGEARGAGVAVGERLTLGEA